MRFIAFGTLDLAAFSGCTGTAPNTGQRQLMLVANDEKQSWTDAGAVVLAAHGRDNVQVIDIGTDPLAPRNVVTLPLANTIAGRRPTLRSRPTRSSHSSPTRSTWSKRTACAARCRTTGCS